MHEQGENVGARDVAFYPSDCSPLTGKAASNEPEPNTPVCAFSQLKNLGEDDVSEAGSGETRNSFKGCKMSEPKAERRYLGVRVRMPVRDMLRRIRLARGVDPATLQGATGKTSKASGEKKRVPSNGGRRSRANKKQIKSLEDLAIIVEVLEEDLKTSKNGHPKRALPATVFSGWEEDFGGGDFPCQDHMFKYSHGSTLALNQESPTPSEVSPVSSTDTLSFSPNPVNTDDMVPSPTIWGGFYSDDSEESFPSPQLPSAIANSHAKWQAPLPPNYPPNSPQDLSRKCHLDRGPLPTTWTSDNDWDGMSFFWFQLQKEESLLKGVSDEELLATDDKGRTLLHNAVSEGKRAQAHVIARRMAALSQLDVRDADGKTALHLSAQRNQHLMVADLLFLGASVNVRDKSGKTCLHLSAENGYIRVLEVLRQSINNGTYMDIEARDANGLSALQCVSMALDANTRALEGSVAPSQTRLHMLRREQLLDTLECLLHMGACWHGPEPAQGYTLTFCGPQMACSTMWVRNIESPPM